MKTTVTKTRAERLEAGRGMRRSARERGDLSSLFHGAASRVGSKHERVCALPGLVLFCFCLLPAVFGLRAFAQGTAFTYQGRLNDSGQPANGRYDFRFRLASDPLANNYIGSAYLTNGIAVSNGLFTTTLDFGPGVFTGSNYWLEVDVRTNGGGSYTALNPLQALTPTPYAIMANAASNLLGALPAGQISGTIASAALPASPSFSGVVTAGAFSGNGANLTNVNAATLDGLGAPNFWQLGGNNVAGGQFLGSTNNQPVELWVGGLRALRLEPGSGSGAPNVIGGSPVNYVASGVVGATIGGGGSTNYGGISYSNSVTASYGTVGGGLQNTASGEFAVVGGGDENTASGNFATVGGGLINNATARYAAVVGGYFNAASGNASVVGGGGDNQIAGDFRNEGLSVVAGGYDNHILTNADFSIVGGGLNNQIYGDTNDYGTGVIAGGDANTIYSNSWNSFIGGGQQNTIGSSSHHSFVGGGQYNMIQANAGFSVIAGGFGNAIETNAGNSFIGGGWGNVVEPYPAYSTYPNYAVIGGGLANTNNGYAATVGGGWGNTASGYAATVGGGGDFVQGNTASGAFATVPGGAKNVAGGNFSFAAGQQAQALNQGDFVWADSQNATFSSTTNDEFSIRAQNGVRIQADKGIHLNAADEPMIVRDWDVFATNAPAYKVGIGRWGLFMEPFHLTLGIPSDDVPNRYFQIAKYSTNGAAMQLVQVDQSGNIIAQGTVTANGVLLTSDRNAKKNFAPVNIQTVLDKVCSLQLSEWNYKTDPAGEKHLGPMAQDFHAAFGLNGSDDKHISVIDEGGVALAAIQGLNDKIESGKQKEETQMQQLEAENAKLKHQNDLLTERLDQLESAVKLLAAQK